MKEMCRKLPIGACPNCGNQNFIVLEHSMDAYLTNKYGEIESHKEISFSADGKCLTCGAEYPMYSTSERFIPLTPLRELMFNNIFEEPKEYKAIENPMGVNKDATKKSNN